MTDIVERLRNYNPPDRTVDDQRQIATDIQEAADIVERLREQCAVNEVTIERLRHAAWLLGITNRELMIEAADEIERLREALNELTTEITQNSVLMDNISLAKFERACAALEPTPFSEPR